jgi:hypothetical protein
LIKTRTRVWLTRLYPRTCRDRYGTEFEELLAECLHSPLDIVDVFLGAIDAHLQLLNGENLTWRIMNMLNKLRTTILIVFASFIGFVVAGFGLVGVLDDSPMIPLMRSTPSLAVWITIIQAGAVIALLSVVVGGFPLGLTLIRRAFQKDHHGVGLLLVPVISFLVLVLYTGFVFLVASGQIQLPGVIRVVQPGNFPIGNKFLLAGGMIVFILGAIASVLAVWKVVSKTDVEQEAFHVGGRVQNVKIYTFALIPALITNISMLLMLISTLVWGGFTFSALPQVFAGNYGMWQTSTQASYFGIVALMFLSTLAAFLGLMRNRSARVAV